MIRAETSAKTATRGSQQTAVAAPDSKSARTRARILDAAAEVLNRRGYAGTRLSNIAEVAQLQAPAIYYYYPSREDVIEAVIQAGQRDVIDHVKAAVAAVGSDASHLDRILAAVAAHLEFVLTKSQYASASIRNVGQLPVEMQDRQVALRREYGAIWHQLFEEGAKAGEFDPDLNPGAARMLILGALNWTPEWWDESRGGVSDIIVETQRLVRRGIAS